MRCQRCGFEIEPGQTFCSMCGTEQAKAIRSEKKKKKIKSILGIIKITSPQHLKMWGNLGLVALIFIWLIKGYNDSPVQVPYICLATLLGLYIFFQCLVPYKNPNASKSKKYKLGVKVTFVLIFILAVMMFLNTGLLELVREI